MDVSRLKIVSDNILKVDGQILQAKEQSPEYLDTVLKVGREVIVQAIDGMYEKVRAREAEDVEVHRGSVLVMSLGKKTLDVLNKDYYFKKYTGLDYSVQGLRPGFKNYFDVVKSNVLIPEIRETVGSADVEGTSLFVRDVPPENHDFFLRRAEGKTVWEYTKDYLHASVDLKYIQS